MTAELTLQALDENSNTIGSAITMHTIEIDDAFANKIFLITPSQSTQTQSLGPEDVIIINLLRITRTIIFTGLITPTASKTAKEIRDDLLSIYDGTTGGDLNKGVRLVYAGENIQGIIEKLAVNEKPSDFDPASDADEKATFQDVPKYTVQVTFIRGVPR